MNIVRNLKIFSSLKTVPCHPNLNSDCDLFGHNIPYDGSPRAVFETDEERLAFLVTIPVHEWCDNRLSSETGSETGSETPTNTIDIILKTIGERPGITNSELADIFGISLRAVGKHLKNLRDNNLIVRTGSPTLTTKSGFLCNSLKINAISKPPSVTQGDARPKIRIWESLHQTCFNQRAQLFLCEMVTANAFYHGIFTSAFGYDELQLHAIGRT